MHWACDNAASQIMCQMMRSYHTAVITLGHVMHLSQWGGFTFGKMALQSLGEFCLRQRVFQWSWHHHLLSGWVEICYVSSQVEDSSSWSLVLSPHAALITQRCQINNRQNVYLLCLRRTSVSSRTVSVTFTDKWLDNKYNSPWFS